MTGLNHAATGALVALVVKQPALALPLAFLSHFAIDALPHWDYKVPGHPKIRAAIVFSDALLSMAALLVAGLWLKHFWLVFLGGLLAILPDCMWLPHIIYGQNSHMDGQSVLHKFRRLHARIQWSDSLEGIYLEAAWFGLIVFMIIKFFAP